MYSVISDHNLICLRKERDDEEGLPARFPFLHLSLFIIFLFPNNPCAAQRWKHQYCVLPV